MSATENQTTDLVAMPRHVARAALATRMSDISEDCWCAGWLTGTEYALWQLANEGGGPWGQGTVTAVDAEELLAMARALGEWPRWSDDPDHDFDWVQLAEMEACNG